MADETATLEAHDIQRILKLLPHRYPFLMVDRIIERQGDESGIGIKNVTFNEPHFQGHFPDNPIMPGVLLVEGMAQTAGAMCIAAGESEEPKVVYFMTIDRCRFRRPVVPGDVVHYHLKKVRRRSQVWKFEAVAKVGETVVAEAVISAMMTER
ncbi:3-hydroxyacyl-ACP dehydratase FabZ [Lutibaculum baratangense]|uniref:3-hydroxyacyl-[acyl-carrier-protein] dehydratase FabZ n=1 Tax=Lutibaculum baratangense AMV1 TaxID=631454 RepID=V4QUR1_9HYPH|nr:3-hydroxyacyl-ACP dehydratase FabZ [Lutibaculum baratangense]ESR23472.1 (3R)-hydroxymyristoyl-[acyl carrier protein] dehydratase [Lutibaculum baratangense AMV1]